LRSFANARSPWSGNKTRSLTTILEKALGAISKGGTTNLNCGTILDGDQTVEEAGVRIFEEMLAVASGKLTQSEEHGFGEEEFQPWLQSATL
jgi:altronate dehydratase